LFLALWPDQAVREAVHACSKKLLVKKAGWHGRLVDIQNLHITLAFLGTVATDQLDCIKGASAQLHWQPFTLSLDHVGYWKRPRVCWLGSTEIPHQLTDMVQQLREGLLRCGFEADQRTYHPHLTLARKCRAPKAITLPMSLQEALLWDVRCLALVSSVTDPAGVRYEIIDSWGSDSDQSDPDKA